MLRYASLRDHIVPLHWLLVHQCIMVKLAVLMFWLCFVSIRQLPACHCHCQLLSFSIQMCMLQRTTTCLQDGAFATVGQRLWNSFPTRLWQPELTLRQFCRELMTHLFGRWLWCLATCRFRGSTCTLRFLTHWRDFKCTITMNVFCIEGLNLGSWHWRLMLWILVRAFLTTSHLQS